MIMENLTPSVERILKYAAIEAERDKGYVSSNHILVGMMMEPGAGIMLEAAGFTIENLRKGEFPNAHSSGT